MLLLEWIHYLIKNEAQLKKYLQVNSKMQLISATLLLIILSLWLNIYKSLLTIIPALLAYLYNQYNLHQ